MNLIIGNTSQLSHYFPKDYIRIGSRDINIQSIKDNIWDSVYICFAEQNMKDDNIDFITPNFHITKNIISEIENSSKKIVIYTSCELWNQLNGPIDTQTPFNYIYPNDYCYSKELLYNWIKNEQAVDKLKNVVIIHPFNFNSVYRSTEYLFGKIFDSIINKKPISIGNTYFFRDIIHTKYMVELSINAEKDEVIGSGELTHINTFIRDLYNYFGMKYEQWVTEDLSKQIIDKNYYAKKTEIYSYSQLMKDTIEDIENKIRNGQN